MSSTVFFAFALATVMGLLSTGCDYFTEKKDDFDSRIACGDYCDKKFDCNAVDPTSAERDDCISACRSSIEDDCGNEHQAAANDQIDDCVSQGCTEFWVCMVFEAAPVCYGFVSE
ncbi:MAG: hypothetical protein CVU65_00235 [Deltaproteobacteria bacterium HGW-Deltaproteobacteria-22]|jgi:hypothetical protein|nr:MAG: hypothetical protein CVU65_00235 [Deltaproteobacteria bacterium HGW-Deltaproteobacteria-22]